MSVDRRHDPEDLSPEVRTPAEDAADRALREGLFALETEEAPEVSPDFDARVMAAVRGRSVWRVMFLSYLRPALATASASAAITLLLVHLTTKPPRPSYAASQPIPVATARAEEARMRQAVEHGTRTYAALEPLRTAGSTDKPETPHKKSGKDKNTVDRAEAQD